MHRDQEPELNTKKPRKRRSDSVYATAKERQADYRARMHENRRANPEQPSPAIETEPPGPNDEKLPVTLCQDPVTETSPEEAETQQSPCYSSSEESNDISETVPLSVTPLARLL
jgi:hypothetical protein